MNYYYFSFQISLLFAASLVSSVFTIGPWTYPVSSRYLLNGVSPYSRYVLNGLAPAPVAPVAPVAAAPVAAAPFAAAPYAPYVNPAAYVNDYYGYAASAALSSYPYNYYSYPYGASAAYSYAWKKWIKKCVIYFSNQSLDFILVCKK